MQCVAQTDLYFTMNSDGVFYEADNNIPYCFGKVSPSGKKILCLKERQQEKQYYRGSEGSHSKNRCFCPRRWCGR